MCLVVFIVRGWGREHKMNRFCGKQVHVYSFKVVLANAGDLGSVLLLRRKMKDVRDFEKV